MILVCAIIGVVIGVVAWFTLSYFTTNMILWIEKKHPHRAGTRLVRTAEVVLCGTTVLLCLTLGFWLATLIWLANR